MPRHYNLFVVQSPLQLLMAQMARDRLCAGEDNRLMMVTLGRAEDRNAQQMRAVYDAHWSKSKLIHHPTLRGLFRSAARIWSTAVLCIGWGLPHKVIAGEYRNPWNKQLGALGRSLTFVDDGASALKLLRLIREKNEGNWPNGMPRAFSIFADQDDAAGIMRNTFDLKASGAHRSEGLIIIGSRYSEGHHMSAAQEMEMLTHLVDLYGDGPVEYVAHRGEDQAKLATIAASGLPVVQLDLPLELDLIGRQTLPRTIVGGYSTALFTCRALFPDMQCVAVRIPTDRLAKSRQDEIEQVYNALDDIGVTVIPLPLKDHPVAQ